uniref:Uncharacterized protein n=1 Tax=Pristionchus pacificus TaxID=54126 RepID=A0A2A6C0A6_PRIPA|eukprot:PDM71568.1 hypothetical protein PRIPAC_37975 [Pristionchus pacificus]
MRGEKRVEREKPENDCPRGATHGGDHIEVTKRHGEDEASKGLVSRPESNGPLKGRRMRWSIFQLGL